MSEARQGSPLILYYLAAGLWFVAGVVTMVKSFDQTGWMPYFCITMGLFFFTMARRRSRREEKEWRDQQEQGPDS